MAKMQRLGQFGHGFKRNLYTHIVQTVEERTHTPGKGPEKLWKNISLFVGMPAILLGMVNSYMKHQQEDHDYRPEFIHYPYMKIMNKRFPWGDGKHSLFHNPKRNYIPGIGYEA